MSADLKIDTSEFQRAMREYAKVSKADAATIINRFAVDVAFRAVTETKAARKSGYLAAGYSPQGGKKFKQRMYYAKQAKKGIKKGEGIAEKAQKAYNQAQSSRGYHKAGWFNAIRDLGKSTRKKPVAGGTADKGYATKATIGKLIANIYNYAIMNNSATGHDETPMQFAALNRAVQYVAKAKLEYARRKLADTAKRFSGRR